MTDVARHEPGPYTWDDFIALGEDDLRELIDGELLEVEVPNDAHELLVPLLIFYLVGWAETHGGGATFASATRFESRTSAASCPTCSSTGPATRLAASGKGSCRVIRISSSRSSLRAASGTTAS
jgi:Uma2 family endonuclease